jgi:hypothetical protein
VYNECKEEALLEMFLMGSQSPWRRTRLGFEPEEIPAEEMMAAASERLHEMARILLRMQCALIYCT